MHRLDEELQTTENAIRSIPGKVECKLDALGEGIANIPSKIRDKMEAFGSFLEETIGSLDDNKVVSIWTQTKTSGPDSENAPDGESDGGGNIDGLIGPTVRADPAKNNVEGVAQGIEMGTKVLEATLYILNITTESGRDSSIMANKVLDTINYQNFNQLKVVLLNGDTTIFQGSSNENKNKNEEK